MAAFGIVFLLGYVAASVNFAILLLRALGKGDPRDRFSGNAGTTNVYRQAGPLWAAVVLLLDLGRAAAIAALAVHLLPAGCVPWIGLGLVAGNRFPCFHDFRGGKGVASFMGFTLFIAPLATALAALLWVAVYGIVRIPFVASFFMILALAIGIITVYNQHPAAVAGAVASALLIFYNHKRNIIGLIGERKKRHEGP
jgi:glycerol-3-phosphate acyltransferase PlsY